MMQIGLTVVGMMRWAHREIDRIVAICTILTAIGVSCERTLPQA